MIPNKATLAVFLLGTVAALGALSVLTDLTFDQGAVFFGSALIGGVMVWSR